jgi:hypothetical protein
MTICRCEALFDRVAGYISAVLRLKMKTDAAVLVGLIAEMQSAMPPDDTATYKSLSTFDKKNGNGFATITVVNDCCARLRTAIELIPNTTDVHKKSFLSAVGTFESNFSLGNMGISWKQFLSNISTPVHTQALHFLDFILQSQEFWKSRQIDIRDVSELLDELETFIKNSDMPDFLRSLLQNDVAKLRFILANHEKFGEQDYWEKFQKLTGLFGAIYMTLDENAREQGRPLIQRMFRNVIVGVSVSADFAQLITTIMPMLPRV